MIQSNALPAKASVHLERSRYSMPEATVVRLLEQLRVVRAAAPHLVLPAASLTNKLRQYCIVKVRLVRAAPFFLGKLFHWDSVGKFDQTPDFRINLSAGKAL
jgi:hypothetical protein